MPWVFLSGQIRDEATALIQAQQLDRLKVLGLVDGIVFSTWTGEFERYPQVMQAYKKLGTILLESPEPNLRTPGYVLHQSLSWIYALQQVPAGVKILRMRPDIAPLNEAFDQILRDDWILDDGGSGLKPTAYEHRLWCHSGLITWPFFLNDVFFYGYKEDVYRLCNADIKLEWVFSEMATEQFFHLGRISQVNPVLELYGRIQRGKHSPAENTQLQKILWESDFWYDVLLNMATELVANYHIGFVPPTIAYSEERLNSFNSISISELLSGKTELPDFVSRPEYGGNSFNSLTWARSMLEGRFKIDVFSERLFSRRDSSENDILNAATTFQDKLGEAFSTYNPVILSDPDIRVNNLAPARIQMAEQSSYIQSMEAEINHMRRQLEHALLK